MHCYFVDRKPWFAWYPVTLQTPEGVPMQQMVWLRWVLRSGYTVNGIWVSKWYEPSS